MAASKKTNLLAKQLFKLSLENGAVSPDRVHGVLGWIEKHAPRQALALLKVYHRQIATEFAKSRAIVEHAGPVTEATLKMIEGAMSQKYHRPITSHPQPNAALLAGLRVRIGSDVYESTVAGQLAELSTSV
ncbi:MAG: F0F1 ATP synthase subunit delta [Candidatus Didemnitutus sp.]|nr:F0F1 ATP synthase subunit delta [Candidatus Didemnitutus sp.]